MDMQKNKKNKTKRKAFSLIETLVTLAVFGILLAMLFQILMLNIKISRKISARTRVREEISELVSLMQRDLRNADYIFECSNGVKDFDEDGDKENGCRIQSQGENIVWVDSSHDRCNGNKICRLDYSTNPNEVMYESSGILTLEPYDSTNPNSGVSFQSNIDPVDNAKAEILITFNASATNDNWDVNTQVRQIAVSTRNYQN